MPRTAAPTVLVAEDVAPLRAQIAALLQAAGWRVDEAGDGPWALRQALQEPPDVLVLDIGLPGLDGLALCRAIRADPALAGMPVIAVTAQAMKTDQQRMRDAGFDAIVTKPLDLPRLMAEIERLLGGARP